MNNIKISGLQTKRDEADGAVIYRFVKSDRELGRIEVRHWQLPAHQARHQYDVIALQGDHEVARYRTDGFGYQSLGEARRLAHERVFEALGVLRKHLSPGEDPLSQVSW